jgi:hypothetical protein
MSNRKVPYNWENVSPGDIISFRYKSKNKTSKLHTILVLNPSLITKGQKKVSTQLIGLKLEESNKIQLKITQKQIQIFEQIGEFESIDANLKSGRGEGLYRLNIDRNMIQNDRKGIKPRAYDLLSKGLGISGAYRTYDYYKARRSAVYLEPIRLFTKLDIDDKKPKQPEKPRQPKKPEGGINENQL